MTKAIYTEALLAIGNIRHEASKRGIENLWVLVPEDLVRFEQRFGYQVVKRGYGWVLMAQPTEGI